MDLRLRHSHLQVGIGKLVTPSIALIPMLNEVFFGIPIILLGSLGIHIIPFLGFVGIPMDPTIPCLECLPLWIVAQLLLLQIASLWISFACAVS